MASGNGEDSTPKPRQLRSLSGDRVRLNSPLSRKRTWDLPNRVPGSPFRRLASPLIGSFAKKQETSTPSSSSRRPDDLLDWIDSMKTKAKAILRTEEEEEKRFYDGLKVEKERYEKQNDVHTEAFEKLKEFLDRDIHIPQDYDEDEDEVDEHSDFPETIGSGGENRDGSLLQDKKKKTVKDLTPYMEHVTNEDIEYDSDGNVILPEDAQYLEISSEESAEEGAPEYDPNEFANEDTEYHVTPQNTSAYTRSSLRQSDMVGEDVDEEDYSYSEYSDQQEDYAETEYAGEGELAEISADLISVSEEDEEYEVNEIADVDYEPENEPILQYGYDSYPVDGRTDGVHQEASGLESVVAAAALQQFSHEGEHIEELSDDNLDYDQADEVIAENEADSYHEFDLPGDIDVAYNNEVPDPSLQLHEVLHQSEPEDISAKDLNVKVDFVAEDFDVVMNENGIPEDQISERESMPVEDSSADFSGGEGEAEKSEEPPAEYEKDSKEQMDISTQEHVENYAEYEEEQYYDSDNELFQDPSVSVFGDISQQDLDVSENEDDIYAQKNESDILVGATEQNVEVVDSLDQEENTTGDAVFESDDQEESTDNYFNTASESFVSFANATPSKIPGPAVSLLEVSDMFVKSMTPEPENTALQQPLQQGRHQNDILDPEPAEEARGKSIMIALGDFAETTMGEPCEKVINGAEDPEREVQATVSRVVGSTETATSEVSSKLSSNAESFSKKLKTKTESVIDAAEKFTHLVEDQPDGSVVEGIESVEQGIKESVEQEAEKILEAELGESGEKLMDEVDELVEVIESDIEDTIENVKEKVSVVSGVLHAMKEFSDAMLAEPNSTISDALDAQEKTIGDLVNKTADEMFETALGESGLDLVDNVDAVVENTLEKVEPVVEDVLNAVEVFTEAVTDETKNMDDISDVEQEIIEAVNETADEMFETALGESGDDLVEHVAEFVEEVTEDIKSISDETLNKSLGIDDNEIDNEIEESCLTQDRSAMLAESTVNEVPLPQKNNFQDALIRFAKPITDPFNDTTVSNPSETSSINKLPNETLSEDHSLVQESTPMRLPNIDLHVPTQPSGLRYSVTASNDASEIDGESSISDSTGMIGESTDVVANSTSIVAESTDFADSNNQDLDMETNFEPNHYTLEETPKPDEDNDELSTSRTPEEKEEAKAEAPSLAESMLQPTPSEEESEHKIQKKGSKTPWKKFFDYFMGLRSSRKRQREEFPDEATAETDKSFTDETGPRTSSTRPLKRAKIEESSSDFKNHIIMKTRSGKIIGANSEAAVAEAERVEEEEELIIEQIAHGEVKARSELRDLASWTDYIENHGIGGHHIDSGFDGLDSNVDKGDQVDFDAASVQKVKISKPTEVAVHQADIESTEGIVNPDIIESTDGVESLKAISIVDAVERPVPSENCEILDNSESVEGADHVNENAEAVRSVDFVENSESAEKFESADEPQFAETMEATSIATGIVHEATNNGKDETTEYTSGIADPEEYEEEDDMPEETEVMQEVEDSEFSYSEASETTMNEAHECVLDEGTPPDHLRTELEVEDLLNIETTGRRTRNTIRKAVEESQKSQESMVEPSSPKKGRSRSKKRDVKSMKGIPNFSDVKDGKVSKSEKKQPLRRSTRSKTK
jgi:hypothetical protein